MSKITTNTVRDTVIALLHDEAEAKLGDRRPDLILGFDVTRDTRATLGWERSYDAAVAERTAALEAAHADAVARYEALVGGYIARRVRALMTTGLVRVRLLLDGDYLPSELHRWGTRQLAKAKASKNAWALAYLVLMLESAAEWEADHDAYGDAATESQAASTESFALVQDGEYDGLRDELIAEVKRTVYRAQAPLTFGQTVTV